MRKFYKKNREFILEGYGNTSQIPQYNSFRDKNLFSFFNRRRVMKHLLSSEVLTPDDYYRYFSPQKKWKKLMSNMQIEMFQNQKPQIRISIPQTERVSKGKKIEINKYFDNLTFKHSQTQKHRVKGNKPKMTELLKWQELETISSQIPKNFKKPSKPRCSSAQPRPQNQLFVQEGQGRYNHYQNKNRGRKLLQKELNQQKKVFDCTKSEDLKNLIAKLHEKATNFQDLPLQTKVISDKKPRKISLDSKQKQVKENENLQKYQMFDIMTGRDIKSSEQ